MASKTIEVPEGYSAVVVFIKDDEEGDERTKIKLIEADQGIVAEAIMALASHQADEIDELLADEEEEEEEDDGKEVVKPS
jgi:hypothetical protein